MIVNLRSKLYGFTDGLFVCVFVRVVVKNSSVVKYMLYDVYKLRILCMFHTESSVTILRVSFIVLYAVKEIDFVHFWTGLYRSRLIVPV